MESARTLRGGVVPDDSRELTVVGSDNAGQYVNRVHPLDQFLVGLLFQVLADVQVVLYEIGRLSQVGRTGSVLAKAG